MCNRDCNLLEEGGGAPCVRVIVRRSLNGRQTWCRFSRGAGFDGGGESTVCSSAWYCFSWLGVRSDTWRETFISTDTAALTFISNNTGTMHPPPCTPTEAVFETWGRAGIVYGGAMQPFMEVKAPCMEAEASFMGGGAPLFGHGTLPRKFQARLRTGRDQGMPKT